LFLMFREHFRFVKEFHNELFYENIEKWLGKVKLINVENKKYLN
jgi:hypothetical protein